MGWKDWSYWLKGGVIALIIQILFFLIDSLNGSFLDTRISLPLIIIWILMGSLNLSFGCYNKGVITLSNCTSYIIVSFILNLLLYFLVGALIGWIIGKVRK